MPPCSVATLPCDATVPDIVAAIDRDGGCIVEGLVLPQLEQMNRDFDDTIARQRPGNDLAADGMRTFFGPTTKRFSGLAAKSPSAFVDVMLNESIKGVTDHFLTSHCSETMLNTGQMMVVGPGSHRQPLHKDRGNWPHIFKLFEVTMTCIVALTDFTAENGATRIVPGSHRWSDESRRATKEEVCQAIMPAGSVLIISGNVLHGAGDNTTLAEWRRGIQLGFTLGWLRTEEAHHLQIPLDVAARLPVRAQRLLGFRSYQEDEDSGLIGMVDVQDSLHHLQRAAKL